MTKPACQRCIKSQRLCLQRRGAKQACFTIHNENLYAIGENKRPRGPRSSLTGLRPHLDLQTQALTRQIQPTRDVPSVAEGMCECVAAWKVSGDDSMVDLALSCIALTVFSRTQQHPAAAIEASVNYHRLLRVVQKRIVGVEISTSNDGNIDACLLTALIMGRYEATTPRSGDLDSNDSFPAMKSWSHEDGAMAILKV